MTGLQIGKEVCSHPHAATGICRQQGGCGQNTWPHYTATGRGRQGTSQPCLWEMELCTQQATADQGFPHHSTATAPSPAPKLYCARPELGSLLHQTSTSSSQHRSCPQSPEEHKPIPSPKGWSWWGQPHPLRPQPHSPEELGPGGPQSDDPAGQALLLSQIWGCGQLLGLHQAAGDAGWCGAGAGWDDHTQPVVPAAPHGAAAGVHHEAHQEPAVDGGEGRWVPCSHPCARHTGATRAGHSPCVHGAGHWADVV